MVRGLGGSDTTHCRTAGGRAAGLSETSQQRAGWTSAHLIKGGDGPTRTAVGRLPVVLHSSQAAGGPERPLRTHQDTTMSLKRLLVSGITGLTLATTAVATGGLTAAVDAAPPRDLAGLWQLNEAAGQVAGDSSRSGNPGTLGSTVGGDEQDPAWLRLPSPKGVVKAALGFDGGDYVRVANAPALEPDGVTVVARVRSSGPGSYRYVLGKGALSCLTASYGLYTGAGGGLSFYVSDGQRFTLSPDAGPGVWDGAWHTVVGGFDGTSVRLFVDGTEVGTGTPSTAAIGYGLPDSGDLLIGGYAGPCGAPLGFVGDIDAAALVGSYDRSAGGLAG